MWKYIFENLDSPTGDVLGISSVLSEKINLLRLWVRDYVLTYGQIMPTPVSSSLHSIALLEMLYYCPSHSTLLLSL